MKRRAPAAARNREPILAVLRRVLPSAGFVVEVASGTGEHAVSFASALSAERTGLVWQPSDVDADARASIAAWRDEAIGAGVVTAEQLLAPLALDAAADAWPIAHADALVVINMMHIAPWTAGLGLLRHAGRLLPAHAPLVLYGPYRRDDVVTAPSNEAFDADLRARDPAWGLRRVEDVVPAAAAEGLVLAELVEMPANNIVLVFRKVAP